jgi:RepB DNA-primase from phage plasmid
LILRICRIAALLLLCHSFALARIFMLAFKNFLQFGASWCGSDEDVKFMGSRAAQVILRSLADLTDARIPTKGVKTGRPGLSGFTYGRSTVSTTLKRLKGLGVIARERAENQGTKHEDFATTAIVPELIAAALRWQKDCQELKKKGKRDANARCVKTELWVPLKSTPIPANPTPERPAEDQIPKLGSTGYQELDTVPVFTPPPASAPAEEESIEPESQAFDDKNNFGTFPKKEDYRYRPYFAECNLAEFRNFTGWLLMVNNSDDVTSVSLMRPGKPGRLSVFENKAKKGLTTINPESVFRLAYAKSKQIYTKEGIGEQLYFSPLDKSRILLIDDLMTSEPVLVGHQYCVLETSAGNFQHFYVADRAISNDERGQIQARLAAAHGGDPAATSGCQPHRVPGSVNYKPDRNLFVTRMVSCSVTGKAVATSDAAHQPAPLATSAVHDDGGCRLEYEPRLPGEHKSQSDHDWAWVMRNWYLGEDLVLADLHRRSVARGKHSGYASQTVAKAARYRASRARYAR